MKKKYLITYVDNSGIGPETETDIYEANDRDEAKLMCLNEHGICEGHFAGEWAGDRRLGVPRGQPQLSCYEGGHSASAPALGQRHLSVLHPLPIRQARRVLPVRHFQRAHPRATGEIG